MRIGAHESVAGGLAEAVSRIEKDGGEAVQIFTKNSSTWKEPVLTSQQIDAFRAATERTRVVTMAHTSYLINLASDKPETAARSEESLVAEVLRCSSLGIPYAVLHPGAHLGAGEEEGIARVVESLKRVLERTPNASTRILLENTAGQGTCVGHRFEHLAEILREVRADDRLGMCLDTQHAFAAGYDHTTEEGYDRTMAAIESSVGLANLHAFHLNDSKKPLGSRVDRHEHIGDGLLGTYVFWRLLNDPRFANHAGVLETEPREDEPLPYAREIGLMKGFLGADKPTETPRAFALESTPQAPKKRRVAKPK